METKTKNGKYFSEIGTWRHLVEIIFLIIVFKIFGILGVIVGSVIIYFVLPKINKALKRK